MKRCNKCAEMKPAEAFTVLRRAKDGRDGTCKACEAVKRAGNKEQRRENNLMWNYGITLLDYERLLRAQDGRCAICNQACAQFPNLSVDHDHETGRVRGLLCASCNLAIGKLRDDAWLLSIAMTYLCTDGWSPSVQQMRDAHLTYLLQAPPKMGRAM